jgi:dTDP-L-rhamnose 4-epimerase
MTTTCLVTGGAGFIGCALSSTLPDHFDRVVALDNLHPQIHPTPGRPADLDERVELVVGDVTSAADWDALLADVRPTAIVHLAAETGTPRSTSSAPPRCSTRWCATTCVPTRSC